VGCRFNLEIDDHVQSWWLRWIKVEHRRESPGQTACRDLDAREYWPVSAKLSQAMNHQPALAGKLIFCECFYTVANTLHLRKDNRFESCVDPTGSLVTGVCPHGGLPGAQEVRLPDLCLLRWSQDGGLGLEGCHN
jgi:hypothetical protein